jgi:hypothetical protein
MNPSLTSIQPYASNSPSSNLKTIFIGPNGLRGGWRLLLFAIMVVAFLAAFLIIRNGGIEGFKEARRNAGHVTVSPWLMIKSELIAFALVCLATWITAKIKRRNFSDYGTPFRRFFGKELVVGLAAGFLAISCTLLLIFAFHGFRSPDLLFTARQSSPRSPLGDSHFF